MSGFRHLIVYRSALFAGLNFVGLSVYVSDGRVDFAVAKDEVAFG